MEEIKLELAQAQQEKEQEKSRNSALLEEIEKLTIVSVHTFQLLLLKQNGSLLLLRLFFDHLRNRFLTCSE